MKDEAGQKDEAGNERVKLKTGQGTSAACADSLSMHCYYSQYC